MLKEEPRQASGGAMEAWFLGPSPPATAAPSDIPPFSTARADQYTPVPAHCLFYWNAAMLICLYLAYEHFCAAAAELNVVMETM